jgi:hypothetical protein
MQVAHFQRLGGERRHPDRSFFVLPHLAFLLALPYMQVARFRIGSSEVELGIQRLTFRGLAVALRLELVVLCWWHPEVDLQVRRQRLRYCPCCQSNFFFPLVHERFHSLTMPVGCVCRLAMQCSASLSVAGSAGRRDHLVRRATVSCLS